MTSISQQLINISAFLLTGFLFAIGLMLPILLMSSTMSGISPTSIKWITLLGFVTPIFGGIGLSKGLFDSKKNYSNSSKQKHYYVHGGAALMICGGCLLLSTAFPDFLYFLYQLKLIGYFN